jgi:16S rRNA (guanine966-N2)-methyltransferase
MRVIAGRAKGHRLKSPASGTRPMTDRMKESIFSSLGDLAGLEVLDLFAGSGSLGIEALSRGASHAIFVENAHEAVARLRHNLEATGLEESAEVLWTEVERVLEQRSVGRVDLIFVDPPYSATSAGVQAVLEEIVMGGHLSDDGRVVVHRPKKDTPLRPLGLELRWERSFGQASAYVFGHEEDGD